MVITLAAACTHPFVCYALGWFTIFAFLGFLAIVMVFLIGFIHIYLNLILHRKF